MTIQTIHRRLTVLHVATINKPIKSDLGYCPIETVIHNLDKGLQSLGHRSIVACSADSEVTGEHYVTTDRSLGDYWQETSSAQQGIINMHLSKALERATMGDIDVIHMHEWSNHIYDGVFNPPLPIVMTLHVPAKDSGMEDTLERYSETLPIPSVHFVPISEYQKRQYGSLLNTSKAVHHGIEVSDFPSKQKADTSSYLFSIGRVASVKGQDKAIEVAIKTGSKLIIAGCVQNKRADKEFFEGFKSSIDLAVAVGHHPVGKDYYDKVIKPLLECDKQIIYIGELDNEQKRQWYRHARATLFPIQWGEPFGLVLIESMACGTPILAFNEGAVPEIVINGKTGFVVDSLSEMIAGLERIDSIDPRECRRHVRNNFSITSMANKYSELYQQIVDDIRYRANAAARHRPALLDTLSPAA
jgi:glycosyltransferase involved in cell wall biosynthesis